MNSNYNNKISAFLDSDEISQRLLLFCEDYKEIELYIVGGYLRDVLLDRKTDDRDYVICGGKALTFAEKVASYFEGYYVILDTDHDIARVVLPNKKDYIDIAGCTGKNIYEDLLRRDFAINSMAYKLETNSIQSIIDPYKGINDLQNRILRVTSEQNIIDDPLRILRAFRIASQLDGEIEQESYKLITKNKDLLNKMAVERINAELNKLFCQPNSFIFVQKLADTGILEILIPELQAQHKVPVNVYHHLGLFEHTLEVYKQLELLIQSESDRIHSHLNEYITPSTKRIVALKYAAILHDIAKPSTWAIDENNKHSFIGHPEQGALMSEEICKRLKIPTNVIKIITKLVKYHLYPSQLSSLYQKPTAKAANRFFRKLEKEVPEAILLAIADRKSAIGPMITNEILNDNIDTLNFLLLEYFKTQDKEESLPKLVDGNDIMNILNISPSVMIGKILKQIHELQLEEAITTKEEAIIWIKKGYLNK